MHSQFTTKGIDALRSASGDSEIRARLYEELGDALAEDFPKVRKALEARLSEWGSDEGEEDEESSSKKGLHEKIKKKLLDEKTWKRDANLVKAAKELRRIIGDQLFTDHNTFRSTVDVALKKAGIKMPAADLKILLKAVSWREETAPPVIAKIHKHGKAKSDPLHGMFETVIKGQNEVVEYERDSELRETEQVTILEEGGIEAFIRREVLPHVPDAWIDEPATKIGYEISFTRYFYKPKPLRSLKEIRADILKVEKESEGLLEKTADLLGIPPGTMEEALRIEVENGNLTVGAGEDGEAWVYLAALDLSLIHISEPTRPY